MAAVDAEKENELLGRILIARGLPEEAVERAHGEAATRGGRLATILWERGMADLDALASALGEVHGIEPAGPEPFFAAKVARVPPLGAKTALRALAVVLRRGADIAEVAFADPSDATALAAVQEELGAKTRVRPRVAPEPLLYAALCARYENVRVPKRLDPLVAELLADPSIAFARRAVASKDPVPVDPQDYITTPMAGAVPRSPDDEKTPILPLGVVAVMSPEDILAGKGSTDDEE